VPSGTGYVRPPLGRHHDEVFSLYQFITKGVVPPEIRHLDKRLEPRLIRGVDRAEEAGLAGILRDWAVVGLIRRLRTGPGGLQQGCQRHLCLQPIVVCQRLSDLL